MTKVDLTAAPTTYQEHLNTIDQAETHAEYSVRQQRMYLDERPFFSKNQLDVAVSRATAKQFGYIMLSFLFGLACGFIACHIK